MIENSDILEVIKIGSINSVSAWALPGLKNCTLKYMNQWEVSEKIIEIVCEFYGVDNLAVRSKSRQREITIARMFCVYFIRKKTPLTLKQIGNLFSGRDHTTAIHSINFIEGQLSMKGINDTKLDFQILSTKVKLYVAQ